MLDQWEHRSEQLTCGAHSSRSVAGHAAVVQATMSRIDRKRLVERLRELADREYQERVWSGAMLPNAISSFAEDVCMTFDDTGLGDASPRVREEELGPTAAKLVVHLQRAIDQVDAKRPVHELVHSVEMARVRELSGKIADLLES